jgi:hypothetical protein
VAEALSVKNTAGGTLDIRNNGRLNVGTLDGTHSGGDRCCYCARGGMLFVDDAYCTASQGVSVDSGGYGQGNFHGGTNAHACSNGSIVAGNFYGSDVANNIYGLSISRALAIGKAWGGTQGRGVVNQAGIFIGTFESSATRQGIIATDFSHNWITEQPVSNGADSGQIYEDSIFWAASGLNLSTIDFRTPKARELTDTDEAIALILQYFGGGGGSPIVIPVDE